MILPFAILANLVKLFFFIFALIMGASTLVIYTEKGTHWAIKTIEAASQGNVSLHFIQGTLPTGLILRNANIQQNDISIYIEETFVHWQPRSLLSGSIHFPEIHIKNIEILLPESAPEHEKRKNESRFPKDITLPLTITFDSFHLDKMEIRSSEEPIINLDYIETSFLVSHSLVAISQFEAIMMNNRFSLSGKMSMNQDWPFELEGNWEAKLPTELETLLDTDSASGSWEANGNFISHIQLQHRLHAGVIIESSIEVIDPLEKMSFSMNHKWQEFRIVDDRENGFHLGDGFLQAEGSTLEWEADLQSTITLYSYPSILVQGNFSGDQKTIFLESLVLSSDQSILQAEAQILLQENLSWDYSIYSDSIVLSEWIPEITANIQPIQLLLKGNGSLPLGTIESNSTHILEKIHSELVIENISFEVAHEPHSLSGRKTLWGGKLILEEFLFEQGTRGQVVLDGQVELKNTMPFQLAAKAMDMDLSFLLPDLMLQIRQLQLQASGDNLLHKEVRHSHLQLETLSGSLSEQPFDARGEVHLQESNLHLQDMYLALGPNFLRAQGQVGDELSLQWDINAPGMHLLFPGLEGILMAGGILTGSVKAPRMKGSANVTNLQYAEYSLHSAEISIDAGLDPQDPFQIDMSITNFSVDQESLTDARLSVHGNITEHQIDLSATLLNTMHWQMKALGGYEPDTLLWSGTVSVLEVIDPSLGHWILNQEFFVEAAPTLARVTPFCIKESESALCIEGVWSVYQGAQGRLSLENFDLEKITPWLPDNLSLFGTLNAQASGAITAGGVVTAEGIMEPTTGFLHMMHSYEEIIEISFSDLFFNADYSDGNLQANLGVYIEEVGSITGEIRTPNVLDDRAPLAGHLKMTVDQMDWLSLFTEDIRVPDGRADVDFTLQGTRAHPKPSGYARILDLRLDVPETGVEFFIPEIRMDWTSDDSGILYGQIRSSDSILAIEGDIQFEDGYPALKVRVSGQDFDVLSRGDVQASISPDLTVQWHPDQPLQIRGELVIPFLNASVPELPEGAISVSDDEYFPNTEDEPEHRDHGIDLRLQVILGSDVRFSGFGLEAKFSGNIDLLQRNGDPMQGFGEIIIVEGMYQSFGQDLRIEQGSVLFQGPLDNPALDIRAERRIRRPEVVVGVHIGGTINMLRSNLFSTPPMDDTEILSFLLTGRPLGIRSDATTGQLLANAAASWGLDQAAVITQRLGSELGLTELDLDTDGEFEGGSLVLGQRLAPRLMLRYSIGIFERGQKLSLQYELTDSLSLETSSTGEVQSADLIFRIER